MTNDTAVFPNLVTVETEKRRDQSKELQKQNLTGVLLQGPVLPQLVRLASPNVLAFFVQSLVSIAEVWYVGKLGTVSLAGLALVYPLLMLMQMMSGGALGGAVASSVARSIGRGNIARAEALIWHSLVLGLVAAGLFSAAYFSFGQSFLELLGGQGQILIEARSYAMVLFLGGFLLWTTNVLSSVFRGMGNMKYPAVLLVLGVCIQIPLSGALILGWGPFPQMGIAGGAVSAIVSSAVMTTLLLWMLILGQPMIKLRNSTFQMQFELFKDILRVGLPAGLSPVLSVFTIICITSLVSRFGPEALAGYGIGARLEFLIIPLIFGIGAALTAMVGVNIGAGNLKRALRIGWTGAAAAGLLSGLIGLIVAVRPDLWLGLYTQDPAVILSGSVYLRIVGSVYLFQGVGLSLYFASQGAGTVFWPVTAGVMRVIVAVGGAAVAVKLGLGLSSIFSMTAAGMALFGIMTGLSILFGAWRGVST
ncbi:MAG: MATE family efflux transporter [Proteobacteria bacterium]|nr:MATE family efflux transporter [Pseudomonadota bacterium]MBU1387009.1 MATE family efflux transporter [Pseudomonadota bacterium]MBU1542310.1 MATE family efflux transporter [Pseudomonadota bacterium]MBU2430545.1 MATE family efflux transporter [Pseudomonadota bacterium]MBU2483027.1 MATE family efflux transporter [Pseudomonadota bacterium]